MKNMQPLEVAIIFGRLQPFVSHISEEALYQKISNSFGLDLNIEEDAENASFIFKTLLEEHAKQNDHEAKRAAIKNQIELLQAQLKALEIKGQ